MGPVCALSVLSGAGEELTFSQVSYRTSTGIENRRRLRLRLAARLEAAARRRGERSVLSMLVALAMSVLADATPLTYTAPNNGIAQGSHCSTFGHLYEGSEDATLWRAGLAFVSSGLMPSKTQGGLILLANLTGAVPAVTPVPIYAEKNFSAYGFRPHGLHLDNSSSKLYAVSHSDQLQEESIFVFDILSKGTLKLPALKFRYLLTSPHFEYYPRKILASLGS